MIKQVLLVMSFATAVVNASTLDVGLVAHNTFNGNADDSSGNGRNLTFRVPGHVSYSYDSTLGRQVLNLTGGNRADYFSSGPSLPESQMIEYTYGLWINPTNLGRNWPEWTYLLVGGWANEVETLRYSENTALHGYTGFGGPFSEFSANKWQHITVTKTGSVWNYYYNGFLNYTKNNGSPAVTFDKNFYYLFNSGGYQYELNGQVSDLVIYDRALTSSEVAQLVPEPSALSLLAIGLGGLAMMRRRRS